MQTAISLLYFYFLQTANAEMCVSCNKRVYATERLSTGNLVYHKACFRCTHCKKTLRCAVHVKRRYFMGL